MNLQNMMMQARKMQKDIEKTKSELESKDYEGNSQFVTAVVSGNGKLKSINIDMEELASDDREILEDMVLVAVNNAIDKMEKDKEEKFGKYGQMFNGLKMNISIDDFAEDQKLNYIRKKIIKNVIDCLKDLPGIGEKTAERLAFSLINFDKDKLTLFSESICGVRDKITNCQICGNICESDVCPICLDKERNGNLIFVVEKAKDISLFEKINVYKGKYHVLGGLISPLEGIGPEDININKLISRIDGDKVNEIILALKPSIEGETTMQYIKKLLENKNVKVTRIATGIPIGTDIEYIDPMTLEFALEGRKDI